MILKLATPGVKSDRLLLIDRDGVINHDSPDYILSREAWQPIENSIEAIARLNYAGYRIIIVTNQSAIGRGYIDLDTLNEIHATMLTQIAEGGGAIDAIAFCPHAPEEGCNCRKPKPGLLFEIAERLHIDLSGVPFVGDSLRDLQAAEAAGAIPVLVLSGNGRKTFELEDPLVKRATCFDTLYHFALHLTERNNDP